VRNPALAAEWKPEWCRVRYATEVYGFSKPGVFALLKAGKIRGKKIDGILLLEVASIEALIAEAPDWRPRGVA